jgi:hypothetical protein
MTTTQRQRISAEQIRTQYARNAEQLADMVEAARIYTNAGAGGPNGKRYAGYFFHQIVTMHAVAAANSIQTDAELAPMVDAYNLVLAGSR